ncbi:MAG: hypothetical protein Q7S40_09750 [Opitutaceae bacterium]|nr:hypothetical protein [Opitutaceae bacterium]
MNSSNKTLIRDQGELIRQFSQLVAQEKQISWESDVLPDDSAPTELRLKLDGKVYRYTPRYFIAPTADDILAVPAAARTSVLLVVPKLAPTLIELCRQHRVSAADLNGRIYLRAPGLLVDRGALPGRDFRVELEPRNVFVGKSVRIVRTLLTDHERVWSQAEIVQRTGASSGLVSRIITHLLRQGLLRKTDPRRFHVVSPSLLLDAWVEADDFARRVTTHRFSALSGDPLALAHSVSNALANSPEAPRFAFTQWIAAWLRKPYTEPPVMSLYLSRLPSPGFLESLGLRPVSDAGRVWFHLPNDEGVFLERRTVNNLPLVTDAQIYLDLQRTGLRGPEQAAALREWEGFCRP